MADDFTLRNRSDTLHASGVHRALTFSQVRYRPITQMNDSHQHEPTSTTSAWHDRGKVVKNSNPNFVVCSRITNIPLFYFSFIF